MAPFSRGRAGYRGRGGRGSFRGRKNAGTNRGQKKSTFNSSRVEEIVESGSTPPVEDDIEGEQEKDVDTVGSDTSSEEEDGRPTARAYHVLLQSLKRDIPQGQPEPKRRRLEKKSHITELQHPEPSADPIASQNVDGDMDAIDDHEEEPSPIATEGEIQEAENEDDEDASDPFDIHFASPEENELARKLQAVSENRWHSERTAIDNLGSSVTLTPDVGHKNFSGAGTRAISGPQDLKLKRRLLGPASKAYPKFQSLQGILASRMFDYQDILFPARTVANAESLRQIYCLHAVNHVLKTRDRVIKNNSRLAKEPDTDADVEVRDQGFTRPKILILLPTRQACAKAVDTITALFEPDQQENKKRFVESYVQNDESLLEDKSEDFKELFGGNDDDMFRLGLKFTRKTVKFFAQFYNSDIILASPLGLRMAIGGEKGKKEDSDFLSSIEVFIVDQASALQMQNWEHIEQIFSHLNRQPKEFHGCDFSRVRTWYLDNQARYLRQTIVLSAFLTPEINALHTTHMRNVAGKTKFLPTYDGEILDVNLAIKQTFSRYDSASISSDPDNRFQYFTTTVIPSLARLVTANANARPSSGAPHQGAGILIFVPSYLDFVRLRNYFSTAATTAHISFGSISEYTPVRDVARARSHFATGRHAVLLYTERAHHFRRYRIRGVKRVVMYGVPDNALFWRELVGGYLGASVAEGRISEAEAAVRAVFSKWDVLKLERIVGSKRVGSMVRERGAGDTFDFV